MQQKHLIVVGGGHGAVQLCSALKRAKKFPGAITLISEENYLPYQRPVLSKAFLYNSAAEIVPLKPASWYAQEQIKVLLNTQVEAIMPEQCQVMLANGTGLTYDYLVLAMGSGPKLLPSLALDLTNSHTLRSAADAVALKNMLVRATQLTIIGGGFLGLEVAATANALGKKVRVLEAGASLMRRSLSPACADYVRTKHLAAGIQISLGATVGAATVHNNRLTHLLINDVPECVQELLVAIGSVPEQTLALAAGIKCNNGIIVDQFMRTSAPNIFAVGDCAAFYAADAQQYWRFESIYNAGEQAKIAAATIMGEKMAYQPLPCFWSEQGPIKLQMVGCLPDQLTTTIRREGKTADEFSLFHYRDTQLVCVESVNAPLDHAYAKQLLAQNIHPPSAQIQDQTVSFQALLQQNGVH